MTTKKRTSRNKPEVILKQFVHYAPSDSGRMQSEPGLLILANREGFRDLADYFDYLANRKWAPGRGDPDDHQHLFMPLPPFNEELSDKMELRLGILTEEFRRETMERYHISKATARRNSLIARYRMFIRWAKRRMSICPR